MKLPKALKVGPIRYTVRLVPKTDLFGKSNHRQSEITVAKWASEPQRRDTLLHEALHAALYCSGSLHVMGIESEDEEKLVRVVTPAVLGLLRDNPDLVDYLLSDD